MADFIEQIPRLMAARRKAAAAAKANAAATSMHWTVLRTIAAQFRAFAREAVVAGCTFPDRPISLAPAETSLLNFGMTPHQFRAETAWRLAEEQGQPPPTVKHPPLPPEVMTRLRERLTKIANVYGDAHRLTRVYNLEPWLQEIYRDRLDIDYAEELQRRIDRHEQDMESVPRGLKATGLAPALAEEVMAAFNQFKSITRSAHMLEREKQSFTDRRQFAQTAAQIEAVLAKTDVQLGSSGARNPARELFAFWKNANFEVMNLTRTLREVWAGTSLDDRIQELSRTLDAVLSTADRAGEDAVPPRPSCPLVMAEEADDAVPYRAAVSGLETLLALEALFPDEPASALTEMRRYGPLSVLVVPGIGRARYAVELRKLLTKVDEDPRRAAAPTERDLDIERRLRYPTNMIVLPVVCPAGQLARGLTEAWLEWKAASRAKALKDLLSDLCAAVPGILDWPADQGPAPPNHARKTLARLLTALAEWLRSGREPAEDEGLPSFAAFTAWAQARMAPPELLVPLRHRASVEAFRGFSAKKREATWLRRLGPRHALDRQGLALALLRKDWHEFADALKWLGPEQRKSPMVDRALADQSGPDLYGDRDRKIDAMLRKFMESDPELKSALTNMETQVAVELDTIRNQNDSLGRRFDYDQVIGSVMQRIATQLQTRRLEANRRIDLYEIGLLYAVDGNLAAAIETLAECLTASKTAPKAENEWQGVGEEWFEEHFPPQTEKFAKRPVPGEPDAAGTECVDYIYYNLGRLYLRMGEKYEALLCFSEFAAQASTRGWHYYGLLARTEYDALKAELLDNGAPPAKTEGKDVTTANKA